MTTIGRQRTFSALMNLSSRTQSAQCQCEFAQRECGHRTNVIPVSNVHESLPLSGRALARISLGALAVSSRARRDLPVGVLLAAVSDSGTRRRTRHSAGAPTSRRFAPRESGKRWVCPPCCGRTRATRHLRSSSSRESCLRCSSSRNLWPKAGVAVSTPLFLSCIAVLRDFSVVPIRRDAPRGRIHRDILCAAWNSPGSRRR